METMTNRKNRRKVLEATVVSDKMDKTRVVKVDWATKHDKYHKVVRRATKFKAHDEKNETNIGDIVRIMETRPLSKGKYWIIKDIISKAK